MESERLTACTTRPPDKTVRYVDDYRDLIFCVVPIEILDRLCQKSSNLGHETHIRTELGTTESSNFIVKFICASENRMIYKTNSVL